MSAIQKESIDREWEAEDVDDLCHLLVEKHGIEGAKKRAFDVMSRLKMLYPEEEK